MPGRRARPLVRVLVAISLCSAFVAAFAVPIPKDLPPVAFQQGGLYRLEVALIVFYGALLLITPAVAGLGQGQLPIEISARGAKFAEGADQSVVRAEAEIESLKRNVDVLTDGLVTVELEIARLQQ